jgi:hypothetical protein
LGDPSYLGEDMFAMQWFVRHKLALGHNLNVMQTCNKMHVGYKIWVEWELGNWIGNKKDYEMFWFHKRKCNHLLQLKVCVF